MPPLTLVSADSEFAPTWLNKGTYVEYPLEDGVLLFDNSTNSPESDQIHFRFGLWRWECIDLNDTTAKLKVTLSYTPETRNGIESDPVVLTAEINVNVFTRAVYEPNGTLIGTTHFWLPSSPSLEDNITLWELAPDKITLQIEGYNQVSTPQGIQKGFRVSEMDAKFNGSSVKLMIYCDLDTGLPTQISLEGEPVLKLFGIKLDSYLGMPYLDKTNVDLGPSDEPFNIWTVLPQIGIAVAIAILAVTLLMRRPKRKH